MITNFPYASLVVTSKFGLDYDGFSEVLQLREEKSETEHNHNINLAQESFMGGFLGALSMLETCVDRFNYDSTILYSYDDVIQAMLAGNMMAYKMIRE